MTPRRAVTKWIVPNSMIKNKKQYLIALINAKLKVQIVGTGLSTGTRVTIPLCLGFLFNASDPVLFIRPQAL